MIQSVKIEKLFGIFDYDISFQNEENILIITGPNGFGKTKILNIIYSLFNKGFLFFQKLVFETIIISLEMNIEVEISKIQESNKDKVIFRFKRDNIEIGIFEYSDKFDLELERNLQRYLSVGKVDPSRWIDHRTNRILSFDEIINEYFDRLPEKVKKTFFTLPSDDMNHILDSIKAHLIKEQRLFKKIQRSYDQSGPDIFGNEIEPTTFMTETIQAYAKELKDLINQNLQRSFLTSQKLDSSFPKRLLNETGKITIEEFDSRFSILKEKQKKLKEYTISESEQEVPEYSESNSNVLLVYLKDSEEKLSVFDNLLNKLELFTSILNERRFTFKSIKIDKEKGFIFITDKGRELKLTDLSSGEQHEVVLLYELIFNAKQNTLVLIDEPEISLHITWQKEFLNDLLKIVELQKIQVIIATHSPSIINDRWDLVYNLQKSES